MNPFNKEPASAAMAQEKAAGFMPGELKRLGQEMLPGFLGQIYIH